MAELTPTLQLSPAQIAQVEARLQADPRVQAILRGASDPRGKMYQLSPLMGQLRREGLLPEGYMVDPNGRVSPIDGWGFKDWGLKVGLPLLGLGTAGWMGAFGGAGGGGSELAASVGAPAATEASIFSSPAAQASAAGVTGTTGGLMERIARRTPWDTVKDVAKVGLPIAGAAIAGNSGGGDANTSAAMPPELNELLRLQLDRIKASQPNYELMLNMAHGMAPQWARDTVAPSGRIAERR